MTVYKGTRVEDKFDVSPRFIGFILSFFRSMYIKEAMNTRNISSQKNGIELPPIR